MSIRFRRLALSAIFVAICAQLNGQESVRTIEVIGSGSASAEPVELTIEAVLSSSGDSAKESYESFAQAKDELRTTFDRMVFPSLELEFQGEQMIDTMSNMGADFPFAMMDDGGAVDDAIQAFGTRETVVLRIKEISKLDQVVLQDMVLELLDRAKANGLTVSTKSSPLAAIYGYSSGPVGMIHYELDSIDSVREAAYVEAMKDSKKRADMLAKLGSGRIGRVISISQHAETTSETDVNPMTIALGMTESPSNQVVDSLSADKPGPIELSVQVKVVYELVDK